MILRIFAIGILAVITVVGLVSALSYNFTNGLVTPAAAVEAEPGGFYADTNIPASEPAALYSFDAVGSVTYYPNNVGTPIPYLVYKSASGATATKILLFGNESTCVAARSTYPCALIGTSLDTYYSGLIRVQGTVENENVLVSRITGA